MWNSNPLLFREKLRVLSSFLIIGHSAESGVYGKIVSWALQPTLMWLFFFFFLSFAQCVGVAQLVFRVFSGKKKIVPYIAVGLGCVGGRE